jgi:hypothetical protein
VISRANSPLQIYCTHPILLGERENVEHRIASTRSNDMKLNRILLGLAIAMPAVSAGQAQITVDVAKITCKQLTLLKVNPDYIAIWLSGYYNAKRDNTVIDIEKFKELTTKVKRDCLYNNQGTVMETVDKLTGSKK